MVKNERLLGYKELGVALGISKHKAWRICLKAEVKPDVIEQGAAVNRHKFLFSTVEYLKTWLKNHPPHVGYPKGLPREFIKMNSEKR